MPTYKKRYLTNSETVAVSRHQKGELNPAELNNWQEMTVGAAKKYGALDSVRGTMAAHVELSVDGKRVAAVSSDRNGWYVNERENHD